MPTRAELTRGEIALLLDVPLMFVSDNPPVEGDPMEPTFSDANVLRVAIARKLLEERWTLRRRDTLSTISRNGFLLHLGDGCWSSTAIRLKS
jgi:hypothetical protein